MILLNASDLPLNVCLPECAVYDTNLVKLLRIICSLPMDRVKGNSIGYVMICTSHLVENLTPEVFIFPFVETELCLKLFTTDSCLCIFVFMYI